MADHVDPKRRSAIMSRVGSKDTKPEMLVRRRLHALGYRYRLHRKDLPGTPDLVFPSKRKALFVHGCYWHGHECKWGRLPKSNVEFWHRKIQANRTRDLRNLAHLKELGWETHVVWQCELKKEDNAINEIVEFLSENAS